jgi:hypothetical protein
MGARAMALPSVGPTGAGRGCQSSRTSVGGLGMGDLRSLGFSRCEGGTGVKNGMNVKPELAPIATYRRTRCLANYLVCEETK